LKEPEVGGWSGTNTISKEANPRKMKAFVHRKKEGDKYIFTYSSDGKKWARGIAQPQRPNTGGQKGSFVGDSWLPTVVLKKLKEKNGRLKEEAGGGRRSEKKSNVR